MDDDIKLIIYLCDKANNFNFDKDNNSIDLPSGEWVFIPNIKGWDSWHKNYYPLLLSKAVDGINETDPWKIDIYYEHNQGWAWTYKDYLNIGEYHKEADGARISALKYVMDQENKTNGK